MDFDIVPDAAGTVSGIITLNYEDASGNPQTFSKDFSVSAEEMNMDDFNYDPSMDDVQPETNRYARCGREAPHRCLRRGGRDRGIVVVVRKRKRPRHWPRWKAEDSDEDL